MYMYTHTGYMRFFKSFLQNLVKNEKKILGRWNIEHCDKKLNSKIDLSNEDHCGPCGQYALDKTVNTIVSNDATKCNVK
jgi:hypothetical protein